MAGLRMGWGMKCVKRVHKLLLKNFSLCQGFPRPPDMLSERMHQKLHDQMPFGQHLQKDVIHKCFRCTDSVFAFYTSQTMNSSCSLCMSFVISNLL